jgi:flagellar export protein FliJ
VAGVKRFEFRLELVLRLKQQRARLAELHQKRARLSVDAAEARVASILDNLARDAAELAARVGRALPAGQWLNARARAARLGVELEAAEAELGRVTGEWKKAAAARARAAAEEEALLYLRRRAEEAHREAAERAEQVRLDELSLLRWRTARDGTGGEFR